MPDDDSFDTLALGARPVYAAGGAQALREWMAAKAMKDKATTSGELRQLANYQWMAGDAVAARATLVNADRALPPKLIDTVDGGQIRHAMSAALIRAGVEIEGKGDADKARKLLGNVDQMLATYEQNGGRHYGLYSLRAESLALQGRKKEAQAAIDEAWKRGWRSSWLLRNQSYFAGITIPGAQ